MPSRLELNATQEQSTLNVASFAQRVRAGGPDALVAAAEAIEKLSAEVQRLQKAARTPQTLKRLSIASADMQDLTVGGEKGPGVLRILSGPPDYAEVGWDGTGDEADPVGIVSISGDTVTTSAPHGAQPNHIVRIEGNSSPYRNGWYRVLTVPTETTYTLAVSAAANGTGGTSTVQFSGGWRRQFAFGGDDYLTAPVFTDPEGGVYVGERGSISLIDALKQVKGFLGLVTEASKVVSGAVDNGSGKVRLAVPAHDYAVGDDVVFTAPGVVASATDAMVTAIVDADTIDVDTAFAGTYTSGGTIYRYRGPFWSATVALGNTGYGDAVFRTFRDGSMRIGLAGGARMEISADGEIKITDSTIELNGPSGKRILLDPFTGEIINEGPTLELYIQNGTAVFRPLGGGNPSLNLSNQSLIITDSGGGNSIILDDNTGIDSAPGYSVGGVPIVDAGRNADFVSLLVGGVPVDLSNYYTKTDIDAMVAALNSAIGGKADASHAHAITITGTTGAAPHTHAGFAS